MSNVGLIWHNEPAWDKARVEVEIWLDMVRPINEGILDRPSRLITHTVFLGPSMNEGPVVHMWGEEGDDDNLHCEWADSIQWVTMDHD